MVGEFVILTGMSGAGRSQAGDALEDLGWYVIDNLPPALMAQVAQMPPGHTGRAEKVAFVTGAGLTVDELASARSELEAHAESVRVLFFDASDEVLIRRYESTKRRHPFAGDRPLSEAIEAERRALRPARDAADLVIDTSGFTIYDCRTRIRTLFGDDEADAEQMQTTVVSFGYKHGLPTDVDLVFDCRFLPNPHWVEELRPQSGLDAPVRDYVFAHRLSEAFLARVTELLELLVPAYRDEGKAYLTIAVGCTGGRHRSVAIAEELTRRLTEHQVRARVIHRDIDK